MSSVIESLERAQLRRIPRFQAGDRVRVHFQVIEGTRRRTQVFEGVVIKRQGHGVRETFTVRKQSFGVGVERTFPVHSPKIEKIDVAARGDVRRAKLYYLRERGGKRARVRERRYTGPEETVTPGLLHDPAAALEAEAAAAPEAVDAEGETATAVGDPGGAPAGGGRPRRWAPRAARPPPPPSPRRRRRMPPSRRPRRPPSPRPRRARAPGPRRRPRAATRREDGAEVDGRLARRTRRHRRRGTRARARHPGVPRQAVPHPERVDGPDARGRPARARQPDRPPLHRPEGRRRRRLPPAARPRHGH